MLSRVRHKLRMMRYYSASRPVTIWTKAHDIAMVGSFFLAFPAAWLCNLMAVQNTTAIELQGLLLRHDDSSISAPLISSQNSRVFDRGGMTFGSFTLVVQDRHRGWPFTTSIHRPPAQLELLLARQRSPQKNVQLPSDDPIRIAIQASLQENDQTDALASFVSNTTQVRQHWLSWFIATGVWWIALMFACSFIIFLAKYTTQIVKSKLRQRKAMLRRQGKCHTCGYDMTGLEFNERCPECGELVW